MLQQAAQIADRSNDKFRKTPDRSTVVAPAAYAGLDPVPESRNIKGLDAGLRRHDELIRASFELGRSARPMSQHIQHIWMQLLARFEWLPDVNINSLRADLGAAITGAILVVPQGVAFAAIAGMPPQYGLYAAMIPTIVAALFGSSRHLVSGPTTAASIVIYSAISSLAIPGSPEYVTLAITLTLMVGVVELLLGLARLGVLVNFISHSVVLGFTAGAALLIATSQIKHFFGVDVPRQLDIMQRITLFVDKFDEINLYATLVGMMTLVTGLVLRRINRKLPFMLISLVAGSLLAVLLTYVFGNGRTNIAFVGALPATLPPLSLPDLSIATLRELAPAVLATTLFAITEATSIGRSLALRSGQRLDGNREFIGQGLSNLAGSFVSSYVATGSFNRSGVNYDVGAQTPLAAVFAGLILMILIFPVAPLTAWLPKSAMAGLLFMVAWNLIDFHHILRIARTSRSELTVLLITFLATLFLELEFAILLGVLASFVVYLRRTSKPSFTTLVPDAVHPKNRLVAVGERPECPQLRIQRIDGSIWFGAVNHVMERFQEQLVRRPKQKYLILLVDSVNFVDVAGAELLIHEAKQRQKRGGSLYLVGLKQGACETLTRGDYFFEIGAENTFDSKRDALSQIVPQLDGEVCRRCTTRLFRECAEQPKPDVT
jgi:SulP family sulfate permease